MQGAQCPNCKNYAGGNKCLAYPGGIPFAIQSGRTSHSTPRKGDGGIVYDPVTTAKPPAK